MTPKQPKTARAILLPGVANLFKLKTISFKPRKMSFKLKTINFKMSTLKFPPRAADAGKGQK